MADFTSTLFASAIGGAVGGAASGYTNAITRDKRDNNQPPLIHMGNEHHGTEA